MSGVEIFVLIGTGYICGLAVASGFILHLLRKVFVAGKAWWRSIIWVVWMVFNTLTAATIPLFLVGALVVGNQPGRLDFWNRFYFFSLGVVVGSVFVLGSIYFVGKRVSINQNGSESAADVDS